MQSLLQDLARHYHAGRAQGITSVQIAETATTTPGSTAPGSTAPVSGGATP